MFTDLALSRDTMKAFLTGKEPDHPAHKLSVMVLQQSVWPFTSRKKDVDLPPSVSLIISTGKGTLLMNDRLPDARSIDSIHSLL